jgi:hypothetical protein
MKKGRSRLRARPVSNWKYNTAAQEGAVHACYFSIGAALAFIGSARNQPHVLAEDILSHLTPRAKLALWLLAGGVPSRAVAASVGLSPGYLRELAAAPAGRDYMRSIESEARREVACVLARAWASATDAPAVAA